MKGCVARAIGMAAIGMTVAWVDVAQAEVRPEDQAAARALFDQGRALVAKGDIQQGCSKLSESQRLDPGVGTLFNLADCSEKLGKTASAWSMFLEVAAQTKAAGQTERESMARERAAKLQASLSRLTIAVADGSKISGLEVKRDGTLVGEPMWGTALPVDPGKHVVTVSAAGRKTWTSTVDVLGPGKQVLVSVPALELEAQAVKQEVQTPTPLAIPNSAAAEPSKTTAGSGNGQRVAGLVVGGLGLVGFGIGTVLAFGAKSSYGDSDPYCHDDICKQEGLAIRDDARAKGNVATIVGGLGLAALAGGLVLYLTAPTAQGASSAPTVGIGPGAVRLTGTW